MEVDAFKTLLEQCEAAIRDGQGHLVGKAMADVQLSRIPRELRLPLANLCRRAQLLALGMKILTPAIRAHEVNPMANSATSAELAEYAVLLIRYGAVDEALQALDQVDCAQVAEGHLYKAFAHFNRWDYASALPILQSYLEADLTPYARLIGQVNLGATLVALRSFDEATELLSSTIALAKNGRYARLEGNCRELRAQVHLQRGHHRRAARDLEAASRLFGAEMTFDELFVRKWRAVLEAGRTGSTQPLARFREEAEARGDSESLREADFHILKHVFDPTLFERLVFGTPFESYRARICEDLGRTPQARVFAWGDPLAERAIDLATGRGIDSLEPGGKIHALIAALLKDFYRPLRLGGLFSELFPEERFDIFSSPDRVHQLLYRTRSWLAQEKIPVEIASSDAGYALRVTGAFQFHVPFRREPLSREHLSLGKLEARYGRGGWGFTPSEARELLAVSEASFRRWAVWACEAKHLQRIGSGRSIRYLFP